MEQEYFNSYINQYVDHKDPFNAPVYQIKYLNELNKSIYRFGGDNNYQSVFSIRLNPNIQKNNKTKIKLLNLNILEIELNQRIDFTFEFGIIKNYDILVPTWKHCYNTNLQIEDTTELNSYINQNDILYKKRIYTNRQFLTINLINYIPVLKNNDEYIFIFKTSNNSRCKFELEYLETKL